MTADATTEAPPLGPYRPVRRLHLGSRSEVWLARDAAGGEVAVKVARTARHRVDVAREYQALSGADHPHVVRAFAKAPDDAWVALEYLRGDPIDAWAAERSEEDLIAATAKLVSGLRYMHDRGVIHGDVKPSNVLVDAAGDPKLFDFDVATLESDETSEFQGTLGYAAPETLRGARPSPRTDMYALGALLYKCVTGRLPFAAGDPAALTWLPLVTLPDPPSTWARDLSAALEHIILVLLARKPTRRPRNLRMVQEALDKVAGSRLADPIIGMLTERDQLRRAVVRVADGGTEVVVLYGPPGSGRRTLLSEAVEAAEREGIRYLKGAGPTSARKALADARQPLVCTFRTSQRYVAEVARAVLVENLPALILVHSDRPIPALASAGAVHYTPALLTREEAVRLVTARGGDQVDAKVWWEQSRGLPIGIVGRLRAKMRSLSGGRVDLGLLPATSRRILDVLQERGELPITTLAQQLEVTEHALLDHCEVLFAEGLVRPSRNGAALRRA